MVAKPPKKSPKASRKRKASDKEQYERFREFAREIEADDDPEAFDRRVRRILTPRDQIPRSSVSSNKSSITRVSKK
jgi:hypothetical protein